MIHQDFRTCKIVLFVFIENILNEFFSNATDQDSTIRMEANIFKVIKKNKTHDANG